MMKNTKAAIGVEAVTEAVTPQRAKRAKPKRVVFADPETAVIVKAMKAPATMPVGTKAVMVSRGIGRGASVTLAAPKERAVTRMQAHDQALSDVRTSIRAAMQIIRRYGSAIPDMGRVKGKTAGQVLAMLCDGPGDGGIPDQIFDAVQDVVEWVLTYVGDRFAARVVLEWARRTGWSDIAAMDPHGRAERQLRNVLHASLLDIRNGLIKDGKEKRLAEIAGILL